MENCAPRAVLKEKNDNSMVEIGSVQQKATTTTPVAKKLNEENEQQSFNITSDNLGNLKCIDGNNVLNDNNNTIVSASNEFKTNSPSQLPDIVNISPTITVNESAKQILKKGQITLNILHETECRKLNITSGPSSLISSDDELFMECERYSPMNDKIQQLSSSAKQNDINFPICRINDNLPVTEINIKQFDSNITRNSNWENVLSSVCLQNVENLDNSKIDFDTLPSQNLNLCLDTTQNICDGNVPQRIVNNIPDELLLKNNKIEKVIDKNINKCLNKGVNSNQKIKEADNNLTFDENASVVMNNTVDKMLIEQFSNCQISNFSNSLDSTIIECKNSKIIETNLNETVDIIEPKQSLEVIEVNSDNFPVNNLNLTEDIYICELSDINNQTSNDNLPVQNDSFIKHQDAIIGNSLPSNIELILETSQVMNKTSKELPESMLTDNLKNEDYNLNVTVSVKGEEEEVLPIISKIDNTIESEHLLNNKINLSPSVELADSKITDNLENEFKVDSSDVSVKGDEELRGNEEITETNVINNETFDEQNLNETREIFSETVNNQNLNVTQDILAKADNEQNLNETLDIISKADNEQNFNETLDIISKADYEQNLNQTQDIVSEAANNQNLNETRDIGSEPANNKYLNETQDNGSEVANNQNLNEIQDIGSEGSNNQNLNETRDIGSEPSNNKNLNETQDILSEAGNNENLNATQDMLSNALKAGNTISHADNVAQENTDLNEMNELLEKSLTENITNDVSQNLNLTIDITESLTDPKLKIPKKSPVNLETIYEASSVLDINLNETQTLPLATNIQKSKSITDVYNNSNIKPCPSTENLNVVDSSSQGKLNMTFAASTEALNSTINVPIGTNLNLPSSTDLEMSSDLNKNKENQYFDVKEEDFQSNGLILNQWDFDFLLSKGNNNNNVHVDRSSLLLKFDPFLGRPTIAQQYQQDFNKNQGQQQQQKLISSVTSPSQGQLSPAVEEDEYFDVTPKSSASDIDNSKKLIVIRNSINLEDNQLVAIKSDPLEVKNKMSIDVVRDMKTDNNLISTNNDINCIDAKHDFKMEDLEKKIQNEVLKRTDEIGKKLKDVEQREEALLRRITEKDKTTAKMGGVIEAYEKAIAEMIAEKEEITHNYERQLSEIKSERDLNYQHLASLESTFADLHVKYERSKQITAKLKADEEESCAARKQFSENLRLQEQRYEKMKNHAIQQLEIANNKLEFMTKNHSSEITKLKAILKKEEISKGSIAEQLQQKTRENEELVKICDELINGQGS